MTTRTGITVRYHSGSESSLAVDGSIHDAMPKVYAALKLESVENVRLLEYRDNVAQYPSHTYTPSDVDEKLVAIKAKVDAAATRAIFGGDKHVCVGYLWGMVAMMEETFTDKEWWLQNYTVQAADRLGKGVTW